VRDAQRRGGEAARRRAAGGQKLTDATRKWARRLEFGRGLILREAKKMGKLTRSMSR
jgi:hypothetical protein